jgi:tetratricopeptide (TPR) repeat protein
MSIDMREPFATLASPLYWLGAAAFLAWGAAGFWLVFKRGNKALLGFALLFPWLMFMTELTTVRIQEIFVLYRSYLWAVGALCAAPLLLARLPARLTIAVALACASVLFLFSMGRLLTMSHPVLLWEDARQVLAGRTELPGASRIYYNLGTEYIGIARPDKAIAEFKQAIASSPDFAEAHGNLGAAYLQQGEWKNAATAFGEAIDIERKNGKEPGLKHLLGRAQSYEKAAEISKSQSDYRDTCRLYKRSCDKVH